MTEKHKNATLEMSYRNELLGKAFFKKQQQRNAAVQKTDVTFF